MNQWLVGLLLCACVAVVLAEKEPEIAKAVCDALAAQVKTEGKKRYTGPKNTFCGETLNEKRTAYCDCAVVPGKREFKLSEFLPSSKANDFLSGRGVAKRSLSEECCNEGCYWEEIEESC